MHYKAIHILLPFLLFSLTTFGQEENTRFFKFLPGYAYEQSRDEGMSPLTYSGSHFNGLIGLTKQTSTKINTADFGVIIGRMSANLPKGVSPSRVLSGRVQFDYRHQRQLKQWGENRLKLFVGGVWNTLANGRLQQRYINNDINYEFSASIGASSSLHYNFNLKKKAFQLSAWLDLPLLSFNLRPSYASSIPEGYIAQEKSDFGAFFASGRVQTLNNFVRIRNEIALQHFLENGNRVQLSYQWDYYNMNLNNPVQMAVHQILLGWFFQF